VPFIDNGLVLSYRPVRRVLNDMLRNESTDCERLEGYIQAIVLLVLCHMRRLYITLKLFVTLMPTISTQQTDKHSNRQTDRQTHRQTGQVLYNKFLSFHY